MTDDDYSSLRILFLNEINILIISSVILSSAKLIEYKNLFSSSNYKREIYLINEQLFSDFLSIAILNASKERSL